MDILPDNSWFLIVLFYVVSFIILFDDLRSRWYTKKLWLLKFESRHPEIVKILKVFKYKFYSDFKKILKWKDILSNNHVLPKIIWIKWKLHYKFQIQSCKSSKIYHKNYILFTYKNHKNNLFKLIFKKTSREKFLTNFLLFKSSRNISPCTIGIFWIFIIPHKMFYAITK